LKERTVEGMAGLLILMAAIAIPTAIIEGLRDWYRRRRESEFVKNYCKMKGIY
jgi:hypothetical protein